MVEDRRTTLGPIAHVYQKRKSRRWLDEIDRRAAQIIAKIQASHGFAEIKPGRSPHWAAALALPGKERIAADEMRDRGFGVYVPESESTEVKKGRTLTRRLPLLPGYVLFFGWALDTQIDRVRACEGIRDVVIRDGHVFVIPDRMVNDLRIAENKERPLKELAKKKRKRGSRRTKLDEDPHQDEIVGTHAYSPIIEEQRKEAQKQHDVGAAVKAFHKAIGMEPTSHD